MSIAIDAGACAGCGRCIAVCPGGLLAPDRKGRAVLRRPEDCWNCAACLKSCGHGAIALYLAPAAGGRGAMLRVSRTGGLLQWRVTLPDGGSRVLTVNSAEASRY